MTGRITSRFGASLRRIGQPEGPSALILLYHRITQPIGDVYGLCVSPDHFREHIEIISREYNSVALVDIAHKLKQGSLPDNAIAVTFDDGYIDNFTVAAPILAQFDVPATVFMTTGLIGRNREFWWDELERIILTASTLPEHLQLTHDDHIFERSLTPGRTLTAEQVAANSDWRIPWADVPSGEVDLPSLRHGLFRELYLLMQPLLHGPRQALLDQLVDWAGATQAIRPDHQALPLRELCNAVKQAPLSIGAHTVDHPSLPSLHANEQYSQMSQSKQSLEEALSESVDAVAYPYGLHDKRTIKAASRAGFRYGCICSDEPVKRSDHLLQLPRIEVPDVDGDSFRRLLQDRLGHPSISYNAVGSEQ